MDGVAFAVAVEGAKELLARASAAPVPIAQANTKRELSKRTRNLIGSGVFLLGLAGLVAGRVLRRWHRKRLVAQALQQALRLGPAPRVER
jgi:hypothetical protein